MVESILFVLVFFSVLAINVALLASYLRFYPVELLTAERVICQQRAELQVIGKPFGKNGKLILTDRRLVWTSIRFPFPRIGNVISIGLGEVERLDTASRVVFLTALVLRASGTTYEFIPGWNALARSGPLARKLKALIEAARQQAIASP